MFALFNHSFSCLFTVDGYESLKCLWDPPDIHYTGFCVLRNGVCLDQNTISVTAGHKDGSQRRIKSILFELFGNREPMQEKPSLPEMEVVVKLRDRPFSPIWLLELVILGFRAALWHYVQTIQQVVGYRRPALGIHGKPANKQEVFRLFQSAEII